MISVAKENQWLAAGFMGGFCIGAAFS